MNEKLVEMLKQIAERRCWHDELYKDGEDTCVDDFAGGNIDDAYEGGYRAGKTLLARGILTEFNISFKIEEV